MKLKRSILWMLLSFSLIPLCIFGIFSIREMEQKIDTMLRCNLKAISETQIANIQKFTDDRKTAMEKIANYALVQDAIKCSLEQSGEHINHRYLENILREQKFYSDYVASVSIIDRNFRVVSSSEKYVEGEISQLKDVEKKYQTGAFVIGNVYERQMDEGLKRVVPAYVGVYADGILIGYISEELDIAYFDELRMNMDTMSEGTFYLLDGKYAIITAGNNTAQTSLQTFTTKSEGPSDFHEKWSAIDFEANPAGELIYTYNHEDYITYYSNVENTEWGVRISENLTAQKRELKSHALLLMLCLFMVGASVAAAQAYMTRKILNPLEQAFEIFRSIEVNQDYSLRMPVESKNEIGTLMEGINELLAYVERERIHEKMMQQDLKVQAEIDALTGVKNKKVIEKQMMDMVEHAAKTGTQVTIGFLDVDDFRRFNTEYGHQKADEVLQYIAETLQNHIKGEVGRIGGDEFLFCYQGEIAEEELERNAKRVLKILEDGFENPKDHIHIYNPPFRAAKGTNEA